MWVRSLGWEDPLEKEMATYSSILAWEVPWTEEPGGYSPRGCKESDMTQHLNNKNKWYNLTLEYYPTMKLNKETLYMLV